MSFLTAIPDPQTVGGELAATADALAVRMAGTSIATLGDLEQAVIDRQELGRAIANVADFFKPLKQMADRLHSAICQRESAILAPLRALDDEKRRAMSAYKAEHDRAMREAERLERERQQRERDARAAAEAAALESQGDHVLAAAVLTEAITSPAPVVVLPDRTKGIEGLKFTRRWHYRVINAALIPAEFMILDEKKLGAYARSMKESARVPGVEFYSTDEAIR